MLRQHGLKRCSPVVKDFEQALSGSKPKHKGLYIIQCRLTKHLLPLQSTKYRTLYGRWKYIMYLVFPV